MSEERSQLRSTFERIRALEDIKTRWKALSGLADWVYGFAAAFVLAWAFDSGSLRTATRFMVAVLLFTIGRWLAQVILAKALVYAPMAKLKKQKAKP